MDALPALLEVLASHHRHPDPGPTFAKFAEDWLTTWVEGGGLRESRIAGDRWIVRDHLVPHFGRFHLVDITPWLVDRFKAEKRQQRHRYGRPYSSKTINNMLSVLHRIFERAVAYHPVEKNPVTKVAWLRPDRTVEEAAETRGWWKPDEEAKAVAHLMNGWRDRYPGRYMAMLVQIVLGLRFSELRALEKRDLDLAASRRTARGTPRAAATR